MEKKAERCPTCGEIRIIVRNYARTVLSCGMGCEDLKICDPLLDRHTTPHIGCILR